MRILFRVAALLILLANAPVAIQAQQVRDSTKVDSASPPGNYGGYSTWKEYLHHQDSLQSDPKVHHVNLAWGSYGIGGSDALPFQFTDWVTVALLNYQRDNLLYTLRYWDQKDYNMAPNPNNNSEAMYEFDALVGIGLYSPPVLINGSLGLGYRHHFHYLSDPYASPGLLPSSEIRNSIAIPVQGNVLFALTPVVGLGLSLFATYTKEGLDHGFAIVFCIGRLQELDSTMGMH